ncbi:hypothetical protein [Massilia sp. S19_KUP03_FR1]|uniref:hypothetical protein n=1 Tax=Massilia sp. S19_KUP03_FR1 TaxID=3025503 RepID=UPI002FCDA471
MNLTEAAAYIAALSCFGATSQLNRLLRLDFPFGDGPGKGSLLVNTMDTRALQQGRAVPGLLS